LDIFQVILGAVDRFVRISIACISYDANKNY